MAIAAKPKAKPPVIPALTPALGTAGKKPTATKKAKLPPIKPAAGKARLVTAVAAKAGSMPIAKFALKASSKASKAAPKPRAAKPVKPKKPKLVRDSFTIPKAEYTVLDDLKQRSVRLASPAKKSELLRAGIKALAAMPDGAFAAALGAVPAVKTGRPSKA